jgi:thiol-disulfide isomerase/thioredoxin
MPRKLRTGRRKPRRKGARKTAKTPTANTKRQLIVGKVYANWCGHCQTLKPEWARMENEIRQIPRMNHVVFVAIEESEKDKMAKFNAAHGALKVSGYPTIFSHGQGGIRYYNGTRDAESLKQWVLGGAR